MGLPSARRARVVAGLVAGPVAGLLLGGCTGSPASHHRSTDDRSGRLVIRARPVGALVDSTVDVTVSDLPRGAATTMTAAATDAGGIVWSSSARFAASRTGTLSLATASATGGSYTGRDPMGLFDLMSPHSSSMTDTEFISPSTGYSVTLTAAAGSARGSATVRRVSPSADIARTQYRPAAAHFYGELDEPLHPTGRKPAVLEFGGSEAGLSVLMSRVLAAHGYPSLALAYFKEPGLPQGLSRIPLEYFATALRTLRSAPNVDPRHVLVAGVSRGSEAALLLGVHYPKLVEGVIAGVPSAVANVGYPNTSSPAWTFAGRPVPTAPVGQFQNPHPSDTAAIIPVERIRGPVFTVCGTSDAVWPSCPYAAAISARRTAHHVPYHDIALSYLGAGHFAGSLVCCFSASSTSLGQTGGDIAADQLARRAVWARLLTFLAAQ